MNGIHKQMFIMSYQGALVLLRCCLAALSLGLWYRLQIPHRMKIRKTKVKCLYDCILNSFAVIWSLLNFRADLMPQWYMPTVSGMPSAKQFVTPKQCREQLTSTMDATVLIITCAEATFLSLSMRKPALLQSSKQIHLMPQKCWYCQAIMYMKMAKGSTIQMLLPEAAHPRYTGNDPIIAPTKVFVSELRFMRVYMNRQLAHMLAPIVAVSGLQEARPARPSAPRPAPRPRAMLGLAPLTRGLWEVLIIFLSSYTSMYWLRACVDMESITEDTKSGMQEEAAGYREYAPIVTIPLSTDNLNLVSQSPCFNVLLLLRVESIVLALYDSIININLSPFFGCLPKSQKLFTSFMVNSRRIKRSFRPVLFIQPLRQVQAFTIRSANKQQGLIIARTLYYNQS